MSILITKLNKVKIAYIKICGKAIVSYLNRPHSRVCHCCILQCLEIKEEG
jgi:hypothetical protein